MMPYLANEQAMMLKQILAEIYHEKKNNHSNEELLEWLVDVNWFE